MYILQVVCLINDIVIAYAKDIFEGYDKKRRKALSSTLSKVSEVNCYRVSGVEPPNLRVFHIFFDN